MPGPDAAPEGPGLRAARSTLALLRNPAARRAVGAVLAERPEDAAAGALRGAESVGLVRRDDAGVPVLDEAFLADAVASLDRALSGRAVLDGARIDLPDVPQAEVDGLVADVARRVLAPGETIAERELNGRLGLFVEDVAFFRRHAVDIGVHTRAADGSAYRLTT